MSLKLDIPRHVPSPATPTPSSTTIGNSSTLSSNKGKAPELSSPPTTPPTSILRRPRKPASPPSIQEPVDEAAWGSNFWVTLVDPQTQTSFFACPATGQVSWDPPVGNFVLPPSADGEWWELSDESRGGLSYYYQTKTGETVWERPAGFVIPLGIIQHTALGRRLSQTNRPTTSLGATDARRASSSARRSNSDGTGEDTSPSKNLQPNRAPSSSKHSPPNAQVRRTSSEGYHHERRFTNGQLTPIPGSPNSSGKSAMNGKNSPTGTRGSTPSNADSISRARAKLTTIVSHRPQPPQSLNAAVEMLTSSQSDSGHGHGSLQRSTTSGSGSAHSHRKVRITEPTTPTKQSSGQGQHRPPLPPPSPRRPIPAVPTKVATVGGKEISQPVMNHAATLEMSPVKNRAIGQPILVEPRMMRTSISTDKSLMATLSTGTYPILPHDLATDIQHFAESDYARQYFSTHRTGFIFRRKVPVNQMMTWQKAPLTSPLLTLMNKGLFKDAVRMFKVIQHIMGDRERERPVNGVRLQPDSHVSMVSSINASTTSLAGSVSGILEEEKWLLSEGLTHGELRDEIYCQLMKQLTGNPSTESTFKGWQLMCVLLITFPPSKDFETCLESFMQQRVTQQEGRVDVMAKYCLRRLAHISKKGPRGKPPAVAEIETASDAAFNPSTFGESLDAIIRLQERNYPHQKVPIILPFLADGILALGGPKAEGIFRVPGEGDSVSELKLRIDRGYYTLDGVDDPHVLASLMKLWLRELCDPLVPEEMYNECITNYNEPEACVRIVERLPTVNRRVVLFVISFLQLFLEERTQGVTKMTPANLALVMAPNLLRCASDSMSVVFTNAQYEQIFVYNLLLHLNCNEVDPHYVPTHGLGGVSPTPAPRVSKSRSRRPLH